MAQDNENALKYNAKRFTAEFDCRPSKIRQRFAVRSRKTFELPFDDKIQQLL